MTCILTAIPQATVTKAVVKNKNLITILLGDKMKKLLLGIILIFSVFMLFSCLENEENNTDTLPMDLENITNEESEKKDATAIDKDIPANENMDNSTEPRPTYTLKAIVKNVDDHHIEVEIIESDYAFGIYWVLTSNNTLYYNENGSIINRNGIKIGTTVEITYSGQTMLSYPPQIVAYTIKQAR